MSAGAGYLGAYLHLNGRAGVALACTLCWAPWGQTPGEGPTPALPITHPGRLPPPPSRQGVM